MFRRGNFLSFVVLLVLTAIAAGRAQAVLRPVSSSGATAHDLAPDGARVVVLFFATTDCPICNRYVPEIERLDHLYAGDGVRFWWVYPDPTDDAAAIAQHRKDFNITGAIFPDPPAEAVEMAHATVTPEAAVFVVEGGQLREVYHGRVDDRYIAIGQERPQATRHDLDAAIQAALAGKPAPPGGPAVGCAIVPAQ
ncbi:MAG TPA: redoxin family protein [Terracidiphilus sp.]|nr:redoxin family protein [Terracidiphilus sp.]